MKVLEPGRKQTGWAIEKKCTGAGNGGGGCGAKLLVEEADVYETESHSYGDSGPTYHPTFKCTNCSVETDLDWYKDRVPTRIKQNPRKRARD